MRTASSILKMNLLECSLLGWLLRGSRYSLMELSVSATNITLFEEDHNKQLLLLILLNAYYAKNFLSPEMPPTLDNEILTLIPHFARVYRAWRPDSTLQQASLGELNATFGRWSHPQRRGRIDYNQLANKILELSKTYNVGAGEEEGPPRKKRKVNEEVKSEAVSGSARDGSAGMSMRLRSRGPEEAPLPQEYDIWNMEDPNGNNNSDFFMRSSRGVKTNRSRPFMNFRDLNESRYSQQYNMGQSLFHTLSRDKDNLPSQPLEDLSISRPVLRSRIKMTSSFDEMGHQE